MKLHVLAGGRLRVRRSLYLPDGDRADTMDLPVSCYLVRHAQGNVLFDTGCHPDALSDPVARWGGIAKVMAPVGPPQTHLIAELHAVGLDPDEVDVVVNSHLHSDHCGCNAFFRRATMICHARELEAATAPGAARQGFLPVDWTPPTPFQTIDAPKDLFDDGRIVLLPLPGHTPGTTGALVGLDRDGEFLLVSDAVALSANLDRDLTPRNTWNEAQSMQSFEQIRRFRDRGTTVLYGHDDEQWRTLRKGVEAYG